MATRLQVKNALDGLVTQVKADIDATLPASVNISPIGSDLTPSPNRWVFRIDAGGDINVANSLRAAIETNLTIQARIFSTKFARRAEDERTIVITSTVARYIIFNF